MASLVAGRLSRDDFIRYFAEAAGNPSQETMEYLAGMFRETEATFGEVTEEQVSRLMPSLGGLGCRKVLRALRDKSGIAAEAARRHPDGKPPWRSSDGSAQSGTGWPGTPGTSSGNTTAGV